MNRNHCCFWLFSCTFWIVKIKYFFNILPIYERFGIWFLNEFFITFDQKRLMFCKKLRVSSNKGHIWTFKHHFWEVHFCLQNEILRTACVSNDDMKRNNVSHFFMSVNAWVLGGGRTLTAPPRTNSAPLRTKIDLVLGGAELKVLAPPELFFQKNLTENRKWRLLSEMTNTAWWGFSTIASSIHKYF